MKKYIKKPLIIIPTIILLLLVGTIAIFKYESLGIILFIMSFILMMISFIEALISKKWLKGFLYFIFYPIILLFTGIWLFTISLNLSDDPRNGTSKFYSDKLNYHIDSNKDIKFNILCKQDSFYESFTGDLNATCIFKLNNKEYKELISEIRESKNFELKNIKNFDHQIDLNELECSKGITFKLKGYQSVNTGKYARIVISTDNKYCLFNLDYY